MLGVFDNLPTLATTEAALFVLIDFMDDGFFSVHNLRK